MIHQRKSVYPVSSIFPNRWSSRAMSGESITDEQLMTLFEAARLAPSAFNEQPWRFIYTHKDTKTFAELFSFIVPANQVWAHAAAALVVVVSKNVFERNGKPSQTASFDTGAACMSFALQGSIDGLVVHAIAGFDYQKTRTLLRIPVEYTIEVMFAVGKPGKTEVLPTELQAREKPSGRKALEKIVFKDIFKID